MAAASARNVQLVNTGGFGPLQLQLIQLGQTLPLQPQFTGGFRDEFGDHKSFCMSCHDPSNYASQLKRGVAGETLTQWGSFLGMQAGYTAAGWGMGRVVGGFVAAESAIASGAATTGAGSYVANPVLQNVGRGYGLAAEQVFQRGFQYNMLENPGPLAALNGNPAASFAGGRYNMSVLAEDAVFYRAGEAGNPLGQWWTREPVGSIAEARIDLAVKPQWIDSAGVLQGTSPIDTSFAVQFPKGTVIYEGPVGYQGGVYLGGGQNQVFIQAPWKLPGVTVQGATKLP